MCYIVKSGNGISGIDVRLLRVLISLFEISEAYSTQTDG